MTKDKRLQIRVTTTELEGINRRAKAAGLSVAEYGRSRLLANDGDVLISQESWGFEDPGLSVEEIIEPEDPDALEHARRITEEAGYPVSDWTPTIPNRDDGPNYAKANGECEVKDLPLGVRCIECGLIHGS